MPNRILLILGLTHDLIVVKFDIDLMKHLNKRSRQNDFLIICNTYSDNKRYKAQKRMLQTMREN